MMARPSPPTKRPLIVLSRLTRTKRGLQNVYARISTVRLIRHAGHAAAATGRADATYAGRIGGSVPGAKSERRRLR